MYSYRKMPMPHFTVYKFPPWISLRTFMILLLILTKYSSFEYDHSGKVPPPEIASSLYNVVEAVSQQ